MVEHLALTRGDNSRWTPAQMLRHVAAEIEAGELTCDKAVLILYDSEEVSPEYWAANIVRVEIAGLAAWLAKRAWEANESE